MGSFVNCTRSSLLQKSSNKARFSADCIGGVILIFKWNVIYSDFLSRKTVTSLLDTQDPKCLSCSALQLGTELRSYSAETSVKDKEKIWVGATKVLPGIKANEIFAGARLQRLVSLRWREHGVPINASYNLFGHFG